jgi:hypothetical protein
VVGADASADNIAMANVHYCQTFDHVASTGRRGAVQFLNTTAGKSATALGEMIPCFDSHGLIGQSSRAP